MLIPAQTSIMQPACFAADLEKHISIIMTIETTGIHSTLVTETGFIDHISGFLFPLVVCNFCQANRSNIRAGDFPAYMRQLHPASRLQQPLFVSIPDALWSHIRLPEATIHMECICRPQIPLFFVSLVSPKPPFASLVSLLALGQLQVNPVVPKSVVISCQLTTPT